MMANLFDLHEKYPSMRDYYSSKEFSDEPVEEVLAAYELEFGEGIYHFNDGKNPANDEEAKRMAIDCLISGKPRPWDKIPEDTVS